MRQPNPSERTVDRDDSANRSKRRARLLIVRTVGWLGVFLSIGLVAGCDKSSDDDPVEKSQASSASDSEGAGESSSKDGQRCRVVFERKGPKDEPPRWAAGEEPDTVRVRWAGIGGVVSFHLRGYGTFAAIQRPLGQGEVTWSSALWRVDCSSPEESSIFAEHDGVDYSRSVFTSKRGRLYASRRGGLVALDLESGEVTSVTKLAERDKSPTGGDCFPGKGSYVPVDIPVFYEPSRDVLTVKQGGPCGYETVWVFRYRELHLDESGSAVETSRPLHHPTHLAMSPDGTIWLADGGRRTLRRRHVFSARGLMRSSDGGETWERVEGTGEKSDQTPTRTPRQIVPSERDPDRILVVGHVYTVDGAGDRGGQLQVTRDGGESWRDVKLPGSGSPTDKGVWTAESLDGTLEKLRIWTIQRGSYSACHPFEFEKSQPPSCPTEKLTVWETNDGGENWEKAENTPAPPEIQRSVETDSGVELQVELVSGRVLRKTGEDDEWLAVYPNEDGSKQQSEEPAGR